MRSEAERTKKIREINEQFARRQEELWPIVGNNGERDAMRKVLVKAREEQVAKILAEGLEEEPEEMPIDAGAQDRLTAAVKRANEAYGEQRRHLREALGDDPEGLREALDELALLHRERLRQVLRSAMRPEVKE